MAAVIEPLMSGAGAPWYLYAIGALISIVLTFFKIPALAFALGMFIPMELNAPLLVGGLISWFVSTRSKDKALEQPSRKRYIACFWFHSRRCFDGSCECWFAFWWYQSYECRMGRKQRRSVAQISNVWRYYRLSDMGMQ